jgi:hypothetical protein
MADPIANVQKLSPRVKLAARLYATGLANKREAAEAAGLHPQYFTALTNVNDPVKRLLSKLDEELMSDTLDMNKALKLMSRKAIGRIYSLMETSPKDDIALKAAIDLADRGPETQKIQRVEVSAFSLDGRDVQALADALVESARTKEQYMQVALEGLVEVQDGVQTAGEAQAAKQAPSEAA